MCYYLMLMISLSVNFCVWEEDTVAAWFHVRLRVKRSRLQTKPDYGVLFLAKTPYSHSSSLQPGVLMGTRKQIRPMKYRDGNCYKLASHSGREAILIRNSDLTSRLTLCTQISVCIFSILFFTLFLSCCQGELVYQSRTF